MDPSVDAGFDWKNVGIELKQLGLPADTSVKIRAGDAGTSQADSRCSGAAGHCFWQASDSVCTTALTVTLSERAKKNERCSKCQAIYIYIYIYMCVCCVCV